MFLGFTAWRGLFRIWSSSGFRFPARLLVLPQLQSDNYFLHVGENTDRLNNTVSTGLTPWDLLWVPDSENSNRLLTEEEGLGVPDLELMVLPCAMHCVVLEHIGHVVGGNEGNLFNLQNSVGSFWICIFDGLN
ncbi:uncharacterized protein LOC126634022 [Malus sylvestris]|uniref:uncharacterized protein LOC126634022 n=1 Tax=Malus sylvestris TaxID=3752 RepID=UPI0021ABDE2E|nr:uncharacterized protein LOC126634022 [Malus sylvestris]